MELGKEQDFSKSKNLHESIELRDFWGVQIRGGGKFSTYQVLVFAIIIVFLTF